MWFINLHRLARAAFAFLISVALAGCDNSSSDTAAQSDAVQTVTSSGGALNTNSLTGAELADIERNTTFISGFATPNADGTFSTSLTPAFTGSFKDSDEYGFAYEVTRLGTSLGARSGLLPGTQVGDLPTTGMAAMSGIWNAAEIGKTDGQGRDYGEPVRASGRITLRADFLYGTLEGETDDFRVLGRFDSAILQGNAYFKDRPAALSGLIGRDRAIGVFHGTDSDTAYSGGFYVSP